MTVSRTREELIALLKMHNQEHMLSFWDELTEAEQQVLIADIEEIDFESFIGDVKDAQDKSALTKIEKVDSSLEPPEEDICGSWITSSQEERKMYNDIGLASISRGEYCSVLMAGGAGTRLGVTYPKGMYSVGLPSNKSLYQLQAERILRLEELARGAHGSCQPLPWYIMTSECTRDATTAFFKKNSYFGLEQEQVVFFEQFTLPVMGLDGKILMESKNRVSKSPDGNGGLYRALHKYGLVKRLQAGGVKHVFVYGVDNILARVADPVFLGFCIQRGAECAAKAVEKTEPKEPVGVLGLVSGKFQVVEYSEIDPTTAARRLGDSPLPTEPLLYRHANICTHLYSLDFLAAVCEPASLTQMPQHIALKKVPHLCLKTGSVNRKPDSVNGIKLEKFVFDVFPVARSFAIWQVDRSMEFSPLKNSPGNGNSDSPETSCASLLDLHRRLLLKTLNNGCRDNTGVPSNRVYDEAALREKLTRAMVEISPALSYGGEDLDRVLECLATVSNDRLEAGIHVDLIGDKVIVM